MAQVGEGNHRLFVTTLILFDVRTPPNCLCYAPALPAVICGFFRNRLYSPARALVVCWELLFCGFLYNHPAAPWSPSSVAAAATATNPAAAVAGGVLALLSFTVAEVPLPTLFAGYLLGTESAEHVRFSTRRLFILPLISQSLCKRLVCWGQA